MTENNKDRYIEVVEAKKYGGSVMILLTGRVKPGQLFKIEELNNTIILTPMKLVEDTIETTDIKIV